MTQYNVALKVNYNGQQVSTGASRNAADLKKLQVATSAQGQAAATASKQNNTLSASYKNLAGAVSIYAAANLGFGFVSDAAASELLTTRIRNLTGSFERNAEVQAYLKQTADDLNVRYSVLANSYSRLIVLENQRTVTAQESRDILEGMTNVAKTLGASNTQVEQSMYGMTQAMTQGRVQAQELNQVVEPLPGLLQAMDKAAGTVSGGFRRMVVNGEVSSQMFKNVLIKALQEYQGAAAASADTISATQAEFRTEYDITVKKLEAPVNAGITPVIRAATSALVLLGDNTEVLGDVADAAVVLSAVLAGKLVGSIAAASAATLKSTLATQAKLVAERNAAAVSLTAAKSQAHYALELQKGAQRQLAAARVDYQRTVAINNLAVRNGQAAAAQNTLTAATARYNTAARSAAVGSRILGTSMGLLGGPIGLVTTAAIAVAYFGSAANDAEVPTDELTRRVTELSEGYKQLTQAQLKARGVRVEEQLASVNSAIDESKTKIQSLRETLSDGKQITNNSFTGLVKVPLTQEEIKAKNDAILLQEAELEKQVEARNKLLETEEAIKARIASGVGPDEKPEQIETVDYQKELEKLILANRTAEETIKDSYARRQAILEGSKQQGLLSEEKYNELSLRIELEKDSELLELERRSEQEKARIQIDAHKAEIIRIQRQNEEKIALIQGFKDREAYITYQSDQQILNEQNEQRIREAKGFANKQQEDEHARQEALLDAEARRTGAVRQLLFSEAEWERKNAAEKTDAVLSIGEFGFKQMAGQSKKAFAMYKAFSITKAVMNTYEMATGAYNAMAPIPDVGPALGVAAALAAVAFGLNQVNQIRGQQYTAAYHGGKHYIPNEQTALLQKGERVVSPKQNVALTAATDKILKNDVGGTTVINHFHNSFTINGSGQDPQASAEIIADVLFKQFESRVVNQYRTGTGAIYQASKAA